MTRAQIIRGGAAVLLAAAGLAWMNSMGSLQLRTVLAYTGLVVFCAGAVSVFLPVRWSGFSRRIDGLFAGLVFGGAFFAAGWFWPAHTIRVAAPSSRLDVYMPSYDFYERHELVIHAPAKQVRAVLDRISFADIGVIETLGRIRAIAMGQFRTPGPGGAPPSMPILTMMNDPRSGFFPLDSAGGEYVFGLAGQPWNNAAVRLKPGEFRSWAKSDQVKIAVNFLIVDLGQGRCRAITETRVAANDESARRKMAKYWTLIYPGTGLIRRSLLEAIRVRAEQP
jgi:hypothetical protein